MTFRCRDAVVTIVMIVTLVCSWDARDDRYAGLPRGSGAAKGQTVLSWAMCVGNLCLVQWLVNEAGADVMATDEHGRNVPMKTVDLRKIKKKTYLETFKIWFFEAL